MKLRLTAILLVLALVFSCGGCIKFGPASPTEEPTAQPTAAPAATDAPTEAPTEAPADGVTIINNSGVDLSEIYISPSYSDDWGNVLGEIDDGESLTFGFDEFEGEPGEDFDIGTLDYDDMCYDCYGVVLDQGSVVTFTVDDAGDYVYSVTTNGSTQIIDANVFSNSGDDPSRVLSIELEVFRDRRYADEPREYSNYTLAHLAAEESEDFPELASAMEKRADERREEQSEERAAQIVYSQYNYDQSGGKFVKCNFDYNCFVRRADSKVTSVLYEIEYTDDRSWYYFYSADNFNSQTGELLKISDVVNDIDALPAVINDVLAKLEVEARLDEDEDYDMYFTTPSCPQFAWMLDYYGLTFFFNDFNGPFRCIHDAARNSITIPFTEYMELWNASFATEVTEYAVNFPYGREFFADIDGSLNEYFMTFDEHEEWFEIMEIYVNGDNEPYTFGKDRWLNFDRSPVFMHSANGDYLYVFTSEEDSYDVYIFELHEDGYIYCMGSYWAGKGAWGFESEYNEERFWDSYSAEAFTDPNCFELEEITDLFGTASGMRYYKVDIDGSPKPLSEMLYTYNTEYIENIKEFELIEVDHEGELYDRFKVPVGTEMRLLRTDGESWADFYLKDGRLGRAFIEVDWNVGYPTIDGVGIDVIFGEDNVMFAG